MGRPSLLAAIFVVLAAAAAAIVLSHGSERLPTEPLAHARASEDGPAPAPAAPDAASAPPVRTLEPEPASAPPAAEDPDAEDDGGAESAPVLDFTPSRAQVEQLRKMTEVLRDSEARQIALGIPADRLKDAALKKFIAARLARSDRALKKARTKLDAATEFALDQKARAIATGVRPDDSAKDFPYAIMRSTRKTPDGKVLEVVVREGDDPALDRARAAYEAVCDARYALVVAIFDAVLAAPR